MSGSRVFLSLAEWHQRTTALLRRLEARRPPPPGLMPVEAERLLAREDAQMLEAAAALLGMMGQYLVTAHCPKCRAPAGVDGQCWVCPLVQSLDLVGGALEQHVLAATGEERARARERAPAALAEAKAILAGYFARVNAEWRSRSGLPPAQVAEPAAPEAVPS